MAIMKSEQILAESTVSFEDAIKNAVSRFSKTVRGLASANFNNMSTTVKNGKIASYRVNLQMTFEIEPASTGTKKTK
ncbi:dodecin family protein [Hyphomonas sp.]|jgi:flavin-binding protein dodecin|uniref:dodecin family protein n=1 Tax=Hyphomonas sp. TaxID=87 RepID=UPI0039E3BF7C